MLKQKKGHRALPCDPLTVLGLDFWQGAALPLSAPYFFSFLYVFVESFFNYSWLLALELSTSQQESG